MTIVGLVLAAIQGLPEPAGSRSELNLIRTEEGHIHGFNPAKAQVYRFINPNYHLSATDGFHVAESFRITPRDGTKHVIHLAEMTNADNWSHPENSTPTKTTELANGRPEAVVACSVLPYY